MGNAVVTGAASGIGIIVYMLSDTTAYMHGSNVWADGGLDAAIRPDVF